MAKRDIGGLALQLARAVDRGFIPAELALLILRDALGGLA